MSLQMTPSLKTALSELYYKEACDQHGWAYVSLKDIDVNSSILSFNKGVHKISIRLMDKIIPEIKAISESVDGNFIFDYLACKVGQHAKYEGAILANPMALCWTKVQNSKFSNVQIDALSRIKLSVAIFRVKDLLAPPTRINVKWDIKSGEEWLNELDELRDQSEYDDEYY